jgi:DNA-binding transcriptional LysR family regulator
VSRSEEPFDTYLLRVLCTLISEKSVSRAAIRLNQSQPAISAALRRLRAIFNDPLLVRDKNRMVPTARALQAVEQARAALGLIDGLLSVGKEFVAETTQLRFTIAMPDYLAPPFMARVVQLMRAGAGREAGPAAAGPELRLRAGPAKRRGGYRHRQLAEPARAFAHVHAARGRGGLPAR